MTNDPVSAIGGREQQDGGRETVPTSVPSNRPVNSRRHIHGHLHESLYSFASTDLRAPSLERPTGNGDSHSVDTSDSHDSWTKSRVYHWVKCSKTLVCLVLVASAVLVGYFSYTVLTQGEEDDLERAFAVSARTILDGSTARAQQGLAQVQSLAGFVATYAQASDAVWPNVTLPDWDALTENARDTAGFPTVSYAPHIATPADRTEWEAYTATAATSEPIVPYIFQMPARTPDNSPGPWIPLWQTADNDQEDMATDAINYNLRQENVIDRLVQHVMVASDIPLSEIIPESTVQVLAGLLVEESSDDESSLSGDPSSLWVVPILPASDATDNDEDTQISTTMVGYIFAVLPWKSLLQGLLPAVKGSTVDVVVQEADACRSNGDTPLTFTYRLQGPKVQLLGMEDLHESKFDDLVETIPQFSLEAGGQEPTYPCTFALRVYPSSDMEEEFATRQPLIFTISVVGVFFFASFIFIVYDCLMQRQQNRTLNKAMRATSIVRSLFPHNVAERLQAQKAEEQRAAKKENRQMLLMRGGKARSLEKMRSEDEEEMSEELVEDKPMADLFPSATVFFADIAGFTAWSSSREPEQVFVLLENLYRAFDKIAVKRQIFKVETIGDCYVAVCGLPTPNEDHAVAMCRFAVECREKFKELRCKLETKLGPDTGDLDLRIGMHSGPVTAGVLRGDRARFQLFGDTVNTASRMESNGEPDRIHMSADTAKLLSEAGKGHWVSARKDRIVAKGKGEMETFWLLTREGSAVPVGPRNKNNYSEGQNHNNTDDLLISSAPIPALVIKNEKFQRMIDWNSEILLQMLRAVIAARANGYKARRSIKSQTLDNLEMDIGQDGTPFEEVGEPPALPPDFDVTLKQTQTKAEDVEVDRGIAKQLHAYVTNIAALYRDNPFHSFEHASHVSMSSVKLLSRVIGPLSRRRQGVGSGSDDDISTEFMAGENSYGITSDPLTQFTVVLAAVVHDCDHRGVPNAVLAREEPSLASMYKNRSLAEQNSLDVAWRVLMCNEYRELRRAIYGTPAELRRFRQILVNTVMATDLFDEEMAAQRNERWGTAFVPTNARDSMASAVSVRDSMASTVSVHYFRAHVVLEYLIQASDVAHTMQHWAVYKKWNGKLYQESYAAWKAGRVDTDPAEIWYDQELHFFDSIVIPLAKRLKESGAFGVSGDEYLNYAEKNRVEWASKGRDVVKALSSSAEGKLVRARRRSSGYGHS